MVYLGKATDAAALAAAMEINWRVCREGGDIRPTSNTYAVAQRYANTNNDYLASQEIWPRVRSIRVNPAHPCDSLEMTEFPQIMFSRVISSLFTRRPT